MEAYKEQLIYLYYLLKEENTLKKHVEFPPLLPNNNIF